MGQSELTRRVAFGASEAQVFEVPSPPELERWVKKWEPWLHGLRLLDVGCGEGHLAAAFQRAGYGIEGVELNAELAARARAGGLIVHEREAVDFVTEQGKRFGGFLLFDFIEHVSPEEAANLLEGIPCGAMVVIQTPNTNSLVGHQFYLQVPSHVAPYSPTVLARMLDRAGYETLGTATDYGGLPWTKLRRRIVEFLLVKLLGTVTTRLLVEGANYQVIARRR